MEATIEPCIFPPAIDYLTKKNQALKAEYSMDKGKDPIRCIQNAYEIAEILFDGEEKPHILRARGNIIDVTMLGMSNYQEPITPKEYSRLDWDQHYICAVGDVVFDPMVGRAMKAEDYQKEVFTEPVILETAKSAEDLSIKLAKIKSLRQKGGNSLLEAELKTLT